MSPRSGTYSRLCRACGTRIDPAAGEIHPLCEPGVMADFRRADVRTALAAGNQGKRRALRNDSAARTMGLQLIRAVAARLEYLSADDLRDTFLAAGINITKAAGGLWSAAVAAEIVEKVGETTGGESAHGKPIHTYRSLIYKGRGAA